MPSHPQKTAAERRKLVKIKSRYGDLSQILFPAVNPDKFLTWLHGYTSFIYTPWFTVLTLAAFAFSVGITVTHWAEIGRDTVQFFTFTDKSWGDFIEFYLLAVAAMCWHEMAHGHACKHYGGRVPSMGFLLIYLTPAFYTDTGEGFVKGTRSERLIISLAGAWAELYIYAVATPIWWATPPDTPVHNAAYLLLMMTGLASLMINWNPLMKLDGYLMLCEIIGISELKETSTAYVSAWVKRNIWRLPVEVPYVPRKRRLGFAVYAILSGIYSYTVLYVIARFVGNVFRNFNPDWSFIPELGTAALIFRSRLRTLGNFMKFIYLDKKDRVKTWFKTPLAMALTVSVLILLLLPLWHESVQGRFVLEPTHRAVVRNQVGGSVLQVHVSEGMTVEAGARLVTLQNLPLQSKFENSKAEYAVAGMRATSAALNYTNLGAATAERDRLGQQNQELRSQAQALEITSPIAGVVLTPRLTDRMGSYVSAGTELVDVGDLNSMRAGIFISEYDVNKLCVGAHARLGVDGFLKKWDTRAVNIAPLSSAIAPGLTDSSKFKGLRAPNFYLVEMRIDNSDGKLRPGMVGLGRIYGERRSALGLAAETIGHFFGRKAW